MLFVMSSNSCKESCFLKWQKLQEADDGLDYEWLDSISTLYEDKESEWRRHTVRRLLTALLPRVAAVLVPTMMKPPPEVAAAELEAMVVVVAGDVLVVLRPLASMRPPPEVDVV